MIYTCVEYQNDCNKIVRIALFHLLSHLEYPRNSIINSTLVNAL